MTPDDKYESTLNLCVPSPSNEEIVQSLHNNYDTIGLKLNTTSDLSHTHTHTHRIAQKLAASSHTECSFAVGVCVCAFVLCQLND